MKNLIAAGIAAACILSGCGRWVKIQQPKQSVVLADGQNYVVEFKGERYKFNNNIHEVPLDKHEEALSKETFSLVLSRPDGERVGIWPGAPGFRALIIQRYGGKTFLVARRHDPERASGWLHFFEGGGNDKWNEMQPKDFPPFLAFQNVSINGAIDAQASSAPWTMIAAVKTVPFPYFENRTGSIWDSIILNTGNAHYQSRPGYEDRLRKFQQVHGRAPSAPSAPSAP